MPGFRKTRAAKDDEDDDICFRKKSRLTDRLAEQQSPSLDALPDECLFEILRRLHGSRERSASACVSRRWLALLAAIRPSEIQEKAASNNNPAKKQLPDLNSDVKVENGDDDDEEEEENYGCLDRFLEGRQVTDVRLASIAIGTAGRGGLGKLLITGTHPTRGATDFGLSAVAHGCPSLHLLSVSNVPSVGDRGLSEIARCCPLLEKLNLTRCPLITDKGLIAVAENCPNLTSLTVDSCLGIADEGIRAIAKLCPKLHSVSIKDCPLVGDPGIAGLMWLASSTLATLKLEGLNVSDLSLACVGVYGKAVTNLYLTGLQNVAERGFWVMGRALGLLKLRSIFVTACRGLTDVGLEAVVQGCPSLKRLSLRQCCCLSDVGLQAFAKAVPELEHLQLEECHRISLVGVVGLLRSCNEKLRTLLLAKCLGIRDVTGFQQPLPVCSSLHTLAIRDCPEFTSSSLFVVGRICPKLVNLDLSGLVGVTDIGLLPLIESSRMGMVRVTLRGCLNLTDAVISTLVKLHGGTLRELHLGGCSRLTDKILLAIADNCYKLEELDMSSAAISDYGVAVLASARRLNLRFLNFGGCSKLTKKSLPLLGNMGSTLEGLNLLHCNRISAKGIMSLEEKMWWCDIFS